MNSNNFELALNPGTSPRLLDIFATGDDSAVVQAVANNPGCPPETLMVLSTHSDPMVRASVVSNPAVPYEVLQSMGEDSSPVVQHWLSKVNMSDAGQCVAVGGAV